MIRRAEDLQERDSRRQALLATRFGEGEEEEEDVDSATERATRGRSSTHRHHQRGSTTLAGVETANWVAGIRVASSGSMTSLSNARAAAKDAGSASKGDNGIALVQIDVEGLPDAVSSGKPPHAQTVFGAATVAAALEKPKRLSDNGRLSANKGDVHR